MKTAVFSVVYPGVEQYLNEFFSSLQQQDDQDFIVYIINDGLANLSFWIDGYGGKIHCKDIDTRGLSPARIRKIGLAWLAMEDVEIVIFADSDDYFATNRVRITKNILQTSGHSVIVNELLLVGDEFLQPQPMINGRFTEGQLITTDCINAGNCCGLSNTTAYLQDVLPVIDQIPDQIVAFDWQLFARILLNGGKITYTNRTSTFYRQHGGNIASPYLTTETGIMRAINIKLAHYAALQQLDPCYSEKYKQYTHLSECLQHDALIKETYIKRISESGIKNPLWWEMIRTLEALAK